MNWLVPSVVLNTVLFFAVVMFYSVAKSFLQQTEELKTKLFKSDQKLAAVEIINAALVSRTLPSFEFDKTTENLIALAVGNANDNESKTAALKACRRIHNQLKNKE